MCQCVCVCGGGGGGGGGVGWGVGVYKITRILTPEEKLEDSKRVTRGHEPKMGRQYNGNTKLD